MLTTNLKPYICPRPTAQAYLEIMLPNRTGSRYFKLYPQCGTYLLLSGRPGKVQNVPGAFEHPISIDLQLESTESIAKLSYVKDEHNSKNLVWRLETVTKSYRLEGSDQRKLSKFETLYDGWQTKLFAPGVAGSVTITFHDKQLPPPIKRVVIDPHTLRHPFMVGLRNPDAQLRIDDPAISREHAIIYGPAHDNSQYRACYMIQDLDSVGGTYIDDERLKPRVPYYLVEHSAVRFVNADYWITYPAISGRKLVLVPKGRAMEPPMTETSPKLIVGRGLTRSVPVKGWRGILPRGPRKTLLQPVDFVLGTNEFIYLVGASGSGKSTLMKLLSTVNDPDGGTLYYAGQNYEADKGGVRAHLGYVPQNNIDHPDLTVRQEMRFAAELRLHGYSVNDLEQRIHAVLTQVRLNGKEGDRIKSLSNGQRKRLNIALELLRTPDVLFLDEPLAGLDMGTAQSIVKLLRTLANEGTSVVMVEHHLDHMHYADYVCWVAGEGYTVYFGSATGVASWFEEVAAYFAAQNNQPNELEGLSEDNQIDAYARIYNFLSGLDPKSLKIVSAHVPRVDLTGGSNWRMVT